MPPGTAAGGLSLKKLAPCGGGLRITDAGGGGAMSVGGA